MEENRKKSRTEILRRYLIFGISLFIIALGISLITRSDLGTSPITSVPYVASLICCQSEYSCFFGYLFLLVYYHPDMHADAAVGEERHYGA